MTAHDAQRRLLLIGGPARVGKSTLAHRILEADHTPWISTDIIRTVLKRIDPAIEPADASHDRKRRAEVMLPYLETLTGVCLAVHPHYTIEGVELLPNVVLHLKEQVATEVRACFLTHTTFSPEDLTGYRGHNRWHADMSEAELIGAASAIRHMSIELACELRSHPQPFWDVFDVGADFSSALERAQAFLLSTPTDPGSPSVRETR